MALQLKKKIQSMKMKKTNTNLIRVKTLKEQKNEKTHVRKGSKETI